MCVCMKVWVSWRWGPIMHEQNTEGKGKGEKKETQVIKKNFENKKLNYFNLI